MSSVWGAYAPEEFHGGKNYPEQITENFLVCRLCSEGFQKKPKILICGHTFCEPCLEHYTGGSRDRAICCPTCGRPTAMPEKGVAGLHNNAFVDTQIDRLLRRDNNAVGRENSRYTICDFRQDSFTNHAYFQEAHHQPHG